MLLNRSKQLLTIIKLLNFSKSSRYFSLIESPYREGENHLLTNIQLTNSFTINETPERFDKIVGTPKSFLDKLPAELLNTELTTNQADLKPSRMLDSYIECIIPLAKDINLRERYGNFYNLVRIGRILEDLDKLAVLICYQHNVKHYPKNHQSPYSIVTASVDRIDTRTRNLVMPIDKDVILRGHITWVGKSSMEVTMEVSQSIDNKNWKLAMIAKFVMVALYPKTGKSAIIHPLNNVTVEEKYLFEAGEKNKNERLNKVSLLKVPPSSEEIKTIHNLFLKTIDERTMTFKNIIRPPNTVWMNETILKKLHLCFPQDRNMYNKIFGGFLMREAFELAWATHIFYTKRRPICLGLADINFRKPVEIGSLLSFASTIVYTKDQSTQIKVNAEVYNPVTDKSSLTNTFQITFMSEGEPVKQIMPATYSEFMMYVDGRRFFKESY